MIVAAISGALVIIGAAFALIAAVGLWRMPDIFMRMHAATKAGPLGAGLLLVGVALSAADIGQATRALAVVIFLFLTAPVAAHLVGRAVYRNREK